MLMWSGKNYGHGQGNSGNLILHKEWEPCKRPCSRKPPFSMPR